MEYSMVRNSNWPAFVREVNNWIEQGEWQPIGGVSHDDTNNYYIQAMVREKKERKESKIENWLAHKRIN